MNLKEKYTKDLLNSIPVVSAMDIEISDINNQSISIYAPLNTNINYEGTAFGGSLNTTCILSCYLLAHHILKVSETSFESLVIQNSSIEYLHPVCFDFIAVSSVSDKNIHSFFKVLKRKGVGRVEISSSIRDKESGTELVRFTARFVAKL